MSAGRVGHENRHDDGYRKLPECRSLQKREGSILLPLSVVRGLWRRFVNKDLKKRNSHPLPVVAELPPLSGMSVEDREVVRCIRDRFDPHGHVDGEHGGEGGLGFGLVHYSLVRLFRPKRALVIGSRFGFVPACVASAIKTNGHGHLDFVDANYSDQTHGFQKAFGGVGYWTTGNFGELSDVITTHLQRSDEFFSKLSADDCYEYIYLDGAHDYVTVKQDFESSASRLADGGIILLHDPLVQNKDFGVSKFLETLSPSQWRWIVLPPWPGLAMVQKS